MHIEVVERDGPRGGEYLVARLSGGREIVISRKPGDHRVWEGLADDPASYAGQRGGVGRLDEMIEENRARLATDPKAQERYFALRELKARKEKL